MWIQEKAAEGIRTAILVAQEQRIALALAATDVAHVRRGCWRGASSGIATWCRSGGAACHCGLALLRTRGLLARGILGKRQALAGSNAWTLKYGGAGFGSAAGESLAPGELKRRWAGGGARAYG